jgi:drug/metabolite transporter (DMT)-like permease
MMLSLHTIILTLSPVVTILWAFVLFDEVPSLRSLAGGVLVVAGVGLVAFCRRR